MFVCFMDNFAFSFDSFTVWLQSPSCSFEMVAGQLAAKQALQVNWEQDESAFDKLAVSQ